MKKGIISSLIIMLMIFSMAVVASADVITLKAEVPEGKILKAYKFTVTYEAAKVKVVETKSANDFTATINNTIPGTIIVNGFNIEGVKGNKGNSSVSIMDITIDGKFKDANFSVTVDDFGSIEDKFEGEAKPEFVVE
jgi:hypothetical protein